MLKTFTFTETRTRAEAVVDQFDMFLQFAGIQERARTKLLAGVENRWLSAIGVYVLNRKGLRILEAEIKVDWDQHLGLARLFPTVRADLPGWEDGAAPEIRTIGRRFGQKANELGIKPTYWVRFNQSIRTNPARYRELCPKVGVVYNSSVPDWEAPPQGRMYKLLDLEEVNAAIRQS
jgi:hypothetical protein